MNIVYTIFEVDNYKNIRNEEEDTLDKLEKLEKLEKLRESGAINEEEFEKEKQKLLQEKDNSKFKGNKKISITFFILSGILLIVTIVFVVFSFHWSNEVDDIGMDYWMAKYSYEDYKDLKYKYRALYEDAKEEFEDIEKEYNEKTKKYHFYKYGRYVTGGLCIASIGVGIIFIERKKKNK